MANPRYSNANAPVRQVHTNTSQEIIQITDDKLRLILNRHLECMEKRKEWVAPFGILMAVVTVFVSSEFKDAFGIPSATWRAIFILSGVGSAGWLIRSIFSAYQSPSIDDVVSVIKDSSSVP